jgi:hypothetical protein
MIVINPWQTMNVTADGEINPETSRRIRNMLVPGVSEMRVVWSKVAKERKSYPSNTNPKPFISVNPTLYAPEQLKTFREIKQ